MGERVWNEAVGADSHFFFKPGRQRYAYIVCRSSSLEKQRPQGTEVIQFSFFVFGSLDLVYLSGKVDD